MATQVLSTAPSHFSQGPDMYTSEVYADYSCMSFDVSTPAQLTKTAYQNFSQSAPTNYIYGNDDQQLSLGPSENWTSQSNGLRRASPRSPHIVHDRTPIRHHKPGMSRNRSVSRSEALLAYATDQAIVQQQQQHSASSTPSLQQTTPATSPAVFPSQAYSTMAPGASFVQQPGYYDNTNQQYTELQPTSNSHATPIPDYFPMNRPDMHVSPLSNQTMSPNESLYLQSSAHSRPASMVGMNTAAMNFPLMSRSLESTTGAIEVSSSRNKPQCWDHGCNGRQFSTFSNLLRHQREKSGTAAKAECPYCKTQFTRTTARNGHVYGGKCRGMPDASKASPPPEDDEGAETS